MALHLAISIPKWYYHTDMHRKPFTPVVYSCHIMGYGNIYSRGGNAMIIVAPMAYPYMSFPRQMGVFELHQVGVRLEI